MQTYITAKSPRWTITLNWIDGDSETMPFDFDAEDAAKAYGEDWIAEQDEHIREFATYWTTKVEPPSYPAYKFGNRWICDGPDGRFHARTKQELINTLQEMVLTRQQFDQEA